MNPPNSLQIRKSRLRIFEHKSANFSCWSLGSTLGHIGCPAKTWMNGFLRYWSGQHQNWFGPCVSAEGCKLNMEFFQAEAWKICGRLAPAGFATSEYRRVAVRGTLTYSTSYTIFEYTICLDLLFLAFFVPCFFLDFFGLWLPSSWNPWVFFCSTPLPWTWQCSLLRVRVV